MIELYCIIYDHDHSFRNLDRIHVNKYITTLIHISKNIGIRDGCTILKGAIGNSCVFVQKRASEVIKIGKQEKE